MKAVFIIIAILVFVVSCSTFPLHKVPVGASVNAVAYDERKNSIKYYSASLQDDPKVNIDELQFYSFNINNWKFHISTKLGGFSEFEAVEVIDEWTKKYEQAMLVLAPGIRPSSYEITIVSNNLTYSTQSTKKYTSLLLPIVFVISVPEDATTKAVFQRVFKTLSHEQYHIYQRLDIDAAPIDKISNESLTTFASICLSQMVFAEFTEPGKNFVSVEDYIEKNHSRAELKKGLAANALTNDPIQHNLAGQLVVAYLFKNVMDRPSKEPLEFTSELDNLCRQFGVNTPSTWEGLFDLYTGEAGS